AIFNTHPHDTVKAKNLLMESLSINPDMDIAHLFLAKLYIREGLFKEAEGGLAAALKKNPFLPKARKELALIKIMSGSDVQKKGYIDYFHLTKNPFDLLPDPDFLYLGDAHSEALLFLLTNIKSVLLNNIKSGRANIILLTGVKGSGKTSMCLKTMDELADEKIAFVYIDGLLLQQSIATESSGLDILIAIKNELGIKTANDSVENVVSALHAHSFMCREARGRTVVIFDNADKFNANTLRAVRTLSQTGIDNIILSGQSDIKNILNAPHLKEVKQGISGIHHLHPLGHEETKEYISKRLALAGGEGKLEITPWAVKIIYNASFGNPEMINKICDLSLDMAMKRTTHIIDEQIVKAAEGSIDTKVDEKLPQIEPIEEKADALSEEEVRKIISGQIAAAVEEAVKKEIEKRAPQFDPVSVVDEVTEKVKRLVNEQVVNMVVGVVKSEMDKRAVQPDASPSPLEGDDQGEEGFKMVLPGQTTGIVGDDRGSEWRLPNVEEGTHQPDTSFVSFEVDEKKNGFFAKNSFLLKTFIVVIAAGTMVAVIANYNILQEITLFSGSNAPGPVEKVEPVNLPATEPPAIKTVPPEVQHAPEDKLVLPEAMPETAPDVSDKPRLLTLTFEINSSGKETVFNGETLKVKRGDKIKIVSADAGGVPANDIVVNLLGFTGDKNKNTGEDRGYLIDTNRDMWEKYSTNGKGSEYPIIVKYRGGKIGEVILKITD
ncbi:MAG TPA: AAA family ATPase, partial [Thermodesulfobacteriota bacterium]|nr:AAA family ATPase [Thermodesulfobacteriota bacterium]